MATWHQQQAFKRNGAPDLSHATLWTCASSTGHLGVIRFATYAEAKAYCDKTGDYIIPPRNSK